MLHETVSDINVYFLPEYYTFDNQHDFQNRLLPRYEKINNRENNHSNLSQSIHRQFLHLHKK